MNSIEKQKKEARPLLEVEERSSKNDSNKENRIISNSFIQQSDQTIKLQSQVNESSLMLSSLNSEEDKIEQLLLDLQTS